MIFVLFHWVLEIDFKDIPWTSVFAISGSPWAIHLWYVRDCTKQQDIQNIQKEIWQKDFHVQLERATSWSNPSLQLSAVYLLKAYYFGSMLPDHLGNEKSLKEAIFHSVNALIKSKELSSSPMKEELEYAIKSINMHVYISKPDWIKNETLKSVDWSQMNFSDLDLSNSDLAGFRMFRSTFGPKMERANLSGASLWGAKFDKSNLRSANLTWTDVSYSDFSGADLSHANFSDASIQGANFKEAINIDKAIFNGARYSSGTNFPLSFTPTGVVKVKRSEDKEKEGLWVPVEE